MKKLLVVLFVFCFSSACWSATYYVQAIGGSYGLEDGSNYDNAFDGFADLDDMSGHTLIVCGTHNENWALAIHDGVPGDHTIIDGECYDSSGDLDRGIIDTVTDNHGFQMINANYITIQNLVFTDPTSTKAGIRLQRLSNVTIQDCSFSDLGDVGGYAIHMNPSSGYDVSNILIQRNTFTGFDTAVAPVRGTIGAGSPDSQDGTIHTLTVDNNIFTDAYIAFRFLGTYANVSSGGLGVGISPYGFTFTNNVINNTVRSCLNTGAGLRTNGANLISGNYFKDCGDSAQSNVNGLQLHWVKNLIVEDNIIDTVETDAADGAGIIIDFAYYQNSDCTDVDLVGAVAVDCCTGVGTGTCTDAYMSDDVIIRRNRINGCVGTGSDGKGISVFRGKNILVNNNVIYENAIGIRQAGVAENVSNEYYHNTIVDSVDDGVLLSSGAPTSTWTNNIIWGNGAEQVDDDSANDPDMSYTIINSGDYSGFTHGAVEINSDPLTGFNYIPTARSPSVDAALLLQLHDPDYRDFNGKVGVGDGFEIGAYEFYKGEGWPPFIFDNSGNKIVTLFAFGSSDVLLIEATSDCYLIEDTSDCLLLE